MSKCQCCKREQELRFGFCFDCVNAESIIEEGVDMYDKEITNQEGMSASMSKVQAILRTYFQIEI
jgi:hypothetical protein